MTFILSLLIFLPKILVGFTITHCLWKDSDLPATILKLSVGVALGFAMSASMFFIAVLFGIAPRAYSWIEFWAALAFVVLFLIHATISWRGNRTVFKASRLDLLSMCIVLTGAILFSSAFLIYSRMHPHGFEDAWSIWNLVPRFIFRENSPAILLNNQFYDRFHPDYPVELSLNITWGWFILKEETPRVPIVLSFLSTITLCTLFWAVLIKWKGIVAATVGTLIMFTLIDMTAVIGQLADPLLTLHLLSAAALFYGYLKTRKSGMLVLSGLLAGFSAWVKNEGILFVGVLFIVCLIAAITQTIKWSELKFLIIGLAGPLLIVFAYKREVEWHNDLFSGANSPYLQLVDFSRWLLIGKSFITHIINYVNTPISVVVILLIYTLLIRFDKNETNYRTLLFLILSGQFAGYFFIYLITPHNLQSHIDTSIDRLISHLFPLAILWLFAGLRSPDFSIKNRTEIVV